MTDDKRRKLWRRHCDKVRQAWTPWYAGELEKFPRTPPFPEELRGLTCGAKTRKGTPCKRTDLYRSGRCKFHGGRSTGPKTEAGKQCSARNLPNSPINSKQGRDQTPWKANKC